MVYNETFDEHLQHVEEVLRRMRDAGLTINPEKVKLAVQEISFLGHIVTSEDIRIDPDRTQGIRDFPPPKDVRGVAQFVGMANFYTKFVHTFGEIAAPLNDLRRREARFHWGQEQDKAFLELKRSTVELPVLHMADFSRDFILQTDASAVGVAAVLSQEHQGLRLPIAYA